MGMDFMMLACISRKCYCSSQLILQKCRELYGRSKEIPWNSKRGDHLRASGACDSEPSEGLLRPPAGKGLLRPPAGKGLNFRNTMFCNFFCRRAVHWARWVKKLDNFWMRRIHFVDFCYFVCMLIFCKKQVKVLCLEHLLIFHFNFESPDMYNCTYSS